MARLRVAHGEGGYDLLWSEGAANDISGLGPYSKTADENELTKTPATLMKNVGNFGQFVGLVGQVSI